MLKVVYAGIHRIHTQNTSIGDDMNNGMELGACVKVCI